MWNHVGVKSTTYNKPSLSLASFPLTNHQFFSAMRNAVLRSRCWKMFLVSRLFLILSWRWFKRILESTYAAVKAPHTSSLTFCDFRGHVKILNWYVSYVTSTRISGTTCSSPSSIRSSPAIVQTFNFRIEKNWKNAVLHAGPWTLKRNPSIDHNHWITSLLRRTYGAPLSRRRLYLFFFRKDILKKECRCYNVLFDMFKQNLKRMHVQEKYQWHLVFYPMNRKKYRHTLPSLSWIGISFHHHCVRKGISKFDSGFQS